MKKLLIVPMLLIAGAVTAHDGATLEQLDRMEAQARRDRVMSRAREVRRQQERLYEEADRDWQHMQIRNDNFLRSKQR